VSRAQHKSLQEGTVVPFAPLFDTEVSRRWNAGAPHRTVTQHNDRE
jgi:hypothetical protein